MWQSSKLAPFVWWFWCVIVLGLFSSHSSSTSFSQLLLLFVLFLYCCCCCYGFVIFSSILHICCWFSYLFYFRFIDSAAHTHAHTRTHARDRERHTRIHKLCFFLLLLHLLRLLLLVSLLYDFVVEFVCNLLLVFGFDLLWLNWDLFIYLRTLYLFLISRVKRKRCFGNETHILLYYSCCWLVGCCCCWKIKLFIRLLMFSRTLLFVNCTVTAFNFA